MNILFVLYGDFGSNSANPLVLYARELSKRGHFCAIAVPSNLETVGIHDNPAFRPLLYTDVLASPFAVFSDGRPADVIHACTPREVVRRFIVAYMAEQPSPLVLYLEDSEHWIAIRSLELDEETLAHYTEQEISKMMPSSIAHPFYCDSFMGLADAVVVIQDKLIPMVPSWVPSKTIMIGVDLDFFSPRKPDHLLRKKYGVRESEKVIVYHGGVNDFTRPAIRILCEAIGLINQQGFPCRLLRTGPFPIDFLGQLSSHVTPFISDLGVLPKQDLPDLLALADVCVQPGEKDSFEDLRLPGKIPEWLAMGLPVVIPNANIAHLFTDGENATLLHNGCPEEIAEKCMDIFSHPQKAHNIGRAGRILAEKYFDVRIQAIHLEEVYNSALLNFSPAISATIWQGQGEKFPFQSRLALKLKLLASSEGVTHIADVGGLLQEYAKLVERMYQRIKGLEDRLAQEQGGVGLMAQSLRRIIVAPIQFFSRKPTYVFGQREFQGGLLLVMRKLKKIYLREGWPGIRFRLHRKLFGSGVVQVSGETAKTKFFVDRNNYPEWIQLYDTFGDEEQKQVIAHIESMSCRPKISVVLPVYDPPLKFLDQAIQSVRNQLYVEWELCIADDASENEMVRACIRRHADEDERIKVVFRSVNGHISQASNAAIDMVTGEYIAFLDHDDLLPPHALLYIAEAINANPHAGLFYSDEDKVDFVGRRHAPYFKPDWNPELFFSHNMICHLSVYRRELVKKVGKLRVGYEGAQDYDLALRCIEHLKPEEIVHVPRVLYHWRRHENSTALTVDAKSYAMLAGKKALDEYFVRNRINAKSETMKDGNGYRIRYTLPETLPTVSLIIFTRNAMKELKNCISSLLEKTIYQNYEVIIVDNASDDPAIFPYLEELVTTGKVRVLRNDCTWNHSALANFAVKHAQGDYVGFLNNSLEIISSHWLGEMVSLAIQSGIGAVGAKLVFPNKTIQSGGVILGMSGWAGHAYQGWPQNSGGYMGRLSMLSNYSAVSGACLVMNKALYQSIGGFDEEKFKDICYDIDLCLRLQEAGYRNIWTPYAELYNTVDSIAAVCLNNNEGKEYLDTEIHFLKQRWNNFLLHDPSYNPNLTLAHADFSLAWPPRISPLNVCSAHALENSPMQS